MHNICNMLVVFKSEHIASSIFHISHLFISLQWKLYWGTEKQPQWTEARMLQLFTKSTTEGSGTTLRCQHDTLTYLKHTQQYAALPKHCPPWWEKWELYGQPARSVSVIWQRFTELTESRTAACLFSSMDPGCLFFTPVRHKPNISLQGRLYYYTLMV